MSILALIHNYIESMFFKDPFVLPFVTYQSHLYNCKVPMEGVTWFYINLGVASHL